MPTTLMAESAFLVRYDGPDLATHQMDVRDLAPALLALGELVQELNSTLYPDHPPVSLKINAAGSGSFSVHLLLSHQEIQTMVGVLSSDAVTAINNVKSLIIMPTWQGLFYLYKHLRGRRIVETVTPSETEQSGIDLVLEDGQRITTSQDVWRSAQNVRIRHRVREAIEPLNRPGIDSVVFRDQETSIEINKGAVDWFDVPPMVQPLLEGEVSMELTVVSVTFNRDNMWRLSDGGPALWYEITDDVFLDRVERGNETFRNGDSLRCRVRFIQARTDAGINTRRIVTQVERHNAAPEPPVPLFPDDGLSDSGASGPVEEQGEHRGS